MRNCDAGLSLGDATNELREVSDTIIEGVVVSIDVAFQGAVDRVELGGVLCKLMLFDIVVRFEHVYDFTNRNEKWILELGWTSSEESSTLRDEFSVFLGRVRRGLFLKLLKSCAVVVVVCIFGCSGEGNS